MNTNSTDKLAETIIKTVNESKPQTVEQLVVSLKEKHHAKENQILDTILKLQSQGKIKLKNPSQPKPHKLAQYIKTNQALWYWTTLATATAAAIIVFIIPEDLYPWIYIRHILGSIFVLWLPGYTFIKALFPTELPKKTSKESLDNIERIALSLGMSLALIPMVGLLLNYTPWGIRLTPIVLSLLALAIIFSTTALIREYQAARQK